MLNIEEDNFSVYAIITNNEGKSVEELINMNGRTQGLKVTDKYKSILKQFWGSHGDGIKYNINLKINRQIYQ